VTAEGGGDGVDGGGVEAADETVELVLTDGAMCRGRRGMGSLGAAMELLEAVSWCENIVNRK
jgi:hypothetical protein